MANKSKSGKRTKSAAIIEDLVGAMESAINSGDWVVDGACDPDGALHRARLYLASHKESFGEFASACFAAAKVGRA